ncbi:MAG: ABC transporter substrate-binding protein [Myxococcales bacterium]|nr:ABC transporter substrate-binding protein [Myxococcales bacterium]
MGRIASIILGATLVACGSSQTPESDGPAPILIGAIFDLTGATSDVGTMYADGLKDYVSWRNDQGGVQGRPLELLSADYAYKVDRAEQLYTRFVSQGAVVFQGWGTGDTEALRGRIASDKVPFMSASYSTGLLDMEEAPYNFLVGTTYSDQAIIGVRHCLEDYLAKGGQGKAKVAILHHDSPFGKSPLAEAQAFADANGVELTTMAMSKGATDYVAELARLKADGVTHVVIHNTAGPASVLVKDAKTQGMDLTFVGLVWVADEIFLKLAGEAAEGVVGAIPFAIPTEELPGSKDAREYLASQGGSLQEKGLHYTQGWWTMGVMLEGVDRAIQANPEAELSGEAIRSALETLKDYDTGGITAPITFTAESHRGNDALRLHKVVHGKWVAIGDGLTSASDPVTRPAPAGDETP